VRGLGQLAQPADGLAGDDAELLVVRVSVALRIQEDSQPGEIQEPDPREIEAEWGAIGPKIAEAPLERRRRGEIELPDHLNA